MVWVKRGWKKWGLGKMGKKIQGGLEHPHPPPGPPLAHRGRGLGVPGVGGAQGAAAPPRRVPKSGPLLGAVAQRPVPNWGQAAAGGGVPAAVHRRVGLAAGLLLRGGEK